MIVVSDPMFRQLRALSGSSEQFPKRRQKILHDAGMEVDVAFTALDYLVWKGYAVCPDGLDKIWITFDGMDALLAEQEHRRALKETRLALACSVISTFFAAVAAVASVLSIAG